MFIFFSTLVATFVGAVSGTYVAQIVSERLLAKKNLLRQLSITNSLISFVFSETNNFLSLKKQYIIPICDNYKIDQAKLHLFKLGFTNNEKFDIKFNFQRFEFGGTNVETILSLSKEINGLDPKCISSITVLHRTDKSIHSILTQRNNFIRENFLNKKFERPIDKIDLYFGCYNDGEIISSEFLDLTDSMYVSVDDAIFFSKTLGELMIVHREKIQTLLKEKFSYIDKNNFNISFEKSKKLLPPKEKYSSWESGFEYVEQKSILKNSSWWMESNPRGRG